MKLRQFNRNLKKEYKNTFCTKKKVDFRFKIRYALLAILVFVFAGLIANHTYVYHYNLNVNDKLEKRIENTKYTKVDSKGEYISLVEDYSLSTKESLLTKLLSFQMFSCTASGGWDEINQPGQTEWTNVQVKGIDEADVAKCDGRYIYSIVDGELIVYDLNCSIISKVLCGGYELYVNDDIIVTIGMSMTKVYLFDGVMLEEKYSIEYDKYIDSRLKDNHIYFVFESKANEDTINYGDCYYDGLCYPRYVYTIVDYNLETMKANTVQGLSGYNVVVYMSLNNFYLVSTTSINEKPITSIMVFNDELKPRGIIKLFGVVLNQFSLHEEDGYLRVAATDNTEVAEKINSVSIFDLKTLKRVGYLNQNIGIGRQIIKSVTYDERYCYIVTYENKDPLYKIDCLDPTNPVIVAKLEGPGYSNYLYNFSSNGEEYILGLGYTDSMINPKISVYHNDIELTQIGEDFIFGSDNYYDQCDYISQHIRCDMFENHKALFIYEDGVCLYLGFQASDEYLILQIDVSDEAVFEYKLKYKTDYDDARSFYVDGNLYLTTKNGLISFQ